MAAGHLYHQVLLHIAYGIGSDSVCRPMCINGNVLPTVKSRHDLGVLMSFDLSPFLHCLVKRIIRVLQENGNEM